MKYKDLMEYYSDCWLSRFKNNHNPMSYAIHLGYFEDNGMPSDTEKDSAKLTMNQFLASLLPLDTKETLTVVDAGCGVGGTCLFLAKRYPNLKLIGVNIHKEQIDFAQNLFIEANINSQQIIFLNEDYTETSIASESVDAAYAMESMCYADKSKLVDEFFRILKPKGVCLFFDYFITKNLHLLSQEEKALLHDFSIGWAVEQYPFITMDDDIIRAGFSDVKSFSLNKNVLPGINHSHNKAIEILGKGKNQSTYTVLHLHALIALKKLIDLNIIDYRVITAIK